MTTADSNNFPKTIGTYTVLERIGSGGFGTVFKAQKEDGALVAIKVLRPELSDDPLLRQRLQREGEAIQAVQGNRTVRVLEVVTVGPYAYLVMELLEGPNLEQLVHDKGSMTGSMLWYVTQGLIEALRDIHAAGIVHRDLKPSNVIFGPDGVKVLDFGISSIADTTSLTNTGAFVGTVAWISPEQISSGESNYSTDVFNLGLVIGYLATGQHAFGSGRSDAVMYRICHSEPETSHIPSPLRELVERCLTKDPLLRPTIDQLTRFIDSSGRTWNDIDSVENGIQGEMSAASSSDALLVVPNGVAEIAKTVQVSRKVDHAIQVSPSQPDRVPSTGVASIRFFPVRYIAGGFSVCLVLIISLLLAFSLNDNDQPQALAPLVNNLPTPAPEISVEVPQDKPVPSSIIQYPPLEYQGMNDDIPTAPFGEDPIIQEVFPGPFPPEYEYGTCNPESIRQYFGKAPQGPLGCSGAWAVTRINKCPPETECEGVDIFRWTDNGWIHRGFYYSLCVLEIDKSGLPRYINDQFLPGNQECRSLIRYEPESTDGPLELGDVGNRVLLIQQRLIEWQLLNDIADRKYGANTQNAITDFQYLAGLEPTGVVDERTALALDLSIF